MSDDNLEPLKTFKVPYFKDNLFKPEVVKPVVVYNKNNLQIGKRLDGSVYTLDIREACRILLLGATRSGKSYTLRSISDRLHIIKKDIIFLNDCKDEFKSGTSPSQSKFHSGLLPGEKPRGLKVVTLRPTFFKTRFGVLPDKNFWYSIDMKSLSKTDFLTLFKVEEMSSAQKTAMDIIYEELRKNLKNSDDDEFFSLEVIDRIIEDIEELSVKQKDSLKFKFRPLFSSHFFEKEHQRSIVSLIRKGYIPSINMEGYDSFGKGGAFAFPEVTLNIILREIIDARIEGVLRPLWIFLDESVRFIGNRKRNSFKDSIQESVGLHTAKNVNYVFASQTINDFPEDILKQCKYIFIPATADVPTIKDVLINTGIGILYTQSALNKAMKLKRMLQRVEYSWIVLNRMDNTCELITPLATLSRHMETSK